MTDREKKRGLQKLQKFEYLKNEKNFFNKIKSIFHRFLKDYQFSGKKKIVDAGFKVYPNEPSTLYINK